MNKNSTKSILQDIQDWLQGDQSDIEAGALLMLKVSRNQILYTNIIRRPTKMKDKLVYELTKIQENLQRRIANDIQRKLSKEQSEELRVMDNQLKTPTPTREGKREDHDLLDPEIQQLYENNLERYPRMTQIHERLKTLELDCDRYPFVKELVEMQQSLIADWKKYDEATPQDPNNITKLPTNLEGSADKNTVTMTPKEVTAARKYISDNKTKLKGEKASDFLPRVQQRVDSLLSAGENISDTQLSELIELGVIVK